MTSGQRVNGRQKRGIFLFKTLFHLSRYHFRFQRYRRVKERIIFNRLPFLSLSLVRISRSHLLSLTYLKLQTNDRRDSQKNVYHAFLGKIYRSIDGATIHNFCTALNTIETSSRDTRMNKKVRTDYFLMTKFFVYSRDFLRANSKAINIYFDHRPYRGVSCKYWKS